MRTDTQIKLKFEGSGDNKEAMKVTRKTLHPLQVAAGDKENLVGAGKLCDLKNMTSGTNSIAGSPKKDKKKAVKVVDKKPTVTADDLTSEENPSESYWQLLAETRRKALEKTLVENQQLHERLEKLSEENKKYKELLEEAQSIIDTLNEVIGEVNSDDSVAEEADIIRRP